MQVLQAVANFIPPSQSNLKDEQLFLRFVCFSSRAKGALKRRLSAADS